MTHGKCCRSEQKHGHCSCCSHGDQAEQESHHHHGHEHGDFAQELLAMADEAWMEVLKEKIKQQIIATSGQHLEELAKIVSHSNKERWKHKLASHKVCQDYKEKLSGYFSQGQG